jgi:carbon catabolite-derepressing protein kinase
MMSMSSARSGISQNSLSPRPYVSKIAILPSSIPAYHKDFIEREKAGIAQDISPTVNNNDEPFSSRTEAEREETARRLKPHARSQLRLDEGPGRPQGMTPINPPKKSKPVRWQFGIRSRNAPWEALLSIHKSLHKLGATYIPDEDYEQVHGKGSEGAPSTEGSFVNDYDGGSNGRGSSSSMDPTKRYKLPADPWHIKVRWDSRSKLPLS